MIPKVIHYCWFGRNPLPKMARKCIASWKKYCPDYQIIEWNEDNFDVNMNAYTKKCYENKKYAFLTDYVRLYVVNEFGGIYFDTDVQVLNPFDELLENEAFFGFESMEYVATGLGFGATKDNPVVHQMIKEYDAFLDGTKDFINCPKLNTNALLKFGLVLNGESQIVNNAHIYSIDTFNPYNNVTGELKITDNTYSIHWYSMSWLSPMVRLRSKIARPFHKLFGKDCFHKGM